MNQTQARADSRPPRGNHNEKTTLVGFLDYLREALIGKTAGLSDEQARTPGVESGTSLMWLIKHMAGVELGWFVKVHRGIDIPGHNSFIPVTDEETLDELVAGYRASIARANEVIAACDDLDALAAKPSWGDQPASMRWILAHMIEETARHAGHADILREQIDGVIGR